MRRYDDKIRTSNEATPAKGEGGTSAGDLEEATRRVHVAPVCPQTQTASITLLPTFCFIPHWPKNSSLYQPVSAHSTPRPITLRYACLFSIHTIPHPGL